MSSPPDRRANRARWLIDALDEDGYLQPLEEIVGHAAGGGVSMEELAIALPTR
jgi:hypothetical protein